MRVLFIWSVPPERLIPLRYSQGVGSLSAVLKRAGHSTSLLQICRYEPEVVEAKIASFKPDLVAVSTTTDQIPFSKTVIERVGSRYGLPIVLGGIHATLEPEDSLKTKHLLGLCRGEGEEALLELVEALEHGRPYDGIKNFWFKKGEEVIKNPLRPLIHDLDSLPFPDRECIDYERVLKEMPEAEFMGSRGCPFPCTYCANEALKELYRDKGPFVRFRSVDNLLAEIKEVLNNYKTIKVLGFHDDIFTLNKAWLRQFCQKYPKSFALPFWCNSRVECMDEEVAYLLKSAGCFEVRIGVESGNDFIRKEVLKRPMSEEKIEEAFKIVKRAGMRAWSFNMIGLPFETEETIKETIAFNRRLKPGKMFISVFRPYPGTRVYELCKSKGWISNRKVNSFFESETILDQPTISRQTVAFYNKAFKFCFYLPPILYLLKVMDKVPLRKGFSFFDGLYYGLKKLFRLKYKILGR